MSLAQGKLSTRLGRESQGLERRRGESPPIGVRALAKLLKVGVSETYHHGLRQSKHAALVAADIDEPEHHEVFELLEALPEDESFFYSKETHLLRIGEVSQVVMEELTHHYGFVGGSQAEYEALKQSSRVAVGYFHSKSSLASKLNETKFEGIAASYPESYGFFKVDVDAVPSVAYEMEVTDVPSVGVQPLG